MLDIMDLQLLDYTPQARYFGPVIIIIIIMLCR